MGSGEGGTGLETLGQIKDNKKGASQQVAGSAGHKCTQCTHKGW